MTFHVGVLSSHRCHPERGSSARDDAGVKLRQHLGALKLRAAAVVMLRPLSGASLRRCHRDRTELQLKCSRLF